jgi:hypothetical protein
VKKIKIIVLLWNELVTLSYENFVTKYLLFVKGTLMEMEQLAKEAEEVVS